jgi:hypothetical protein
MAATGERRVDWRRRDGRDALSGSSSPLTSADLVSGVGTSRRDPRTNVGPVHELCRSCVDLRAAALELWCSLTHRLRLGCGLAILASSGDDEPWPSSLMFASWCSRRAIFAPSWLLAPLPTNRSAVHEHSSCLPATLDKEFRDSVAEFARRLDRGCHGLGDFRDVAEIVRARITATSSRSSVPTMTITWSARPTTGGRAQLAANGAKFRIRDFAAYYLSQIVDKPLALKEEPPMRGAPDERRLHHARRRDREARGRLAQRLSATSATPALVTMPGTAGGQRQHPGPREQTRCARRTNLRPRDLDGQATVVFLPIPQRPRRRSPSRTWKLSSSLDHPCDDRRSTR